MKAIARRIEVLVAAAALVSGSTLAQPVVRCGNAYGETPCAGGKAVPAADPRTATQRAQAAEVIKRDAKTADALEAARLAAEAQARAQPTGTARVAPVAQKARSSANPAPVSAFKAAVPAGPQQSARGRKGSRKAAGTREPRNTRQQPNENMKAGRSGSRAPMESSGASGGADTRLLAPRGLYSP